MAKLKAPLLSFDARGKIADTLVFSSWKGIATARQYVVPANPKTTAQLAQRAELTAVVAAIHAMEVLGADPLVQADKDAYNLRGTVSGNPMTWFNVVCRDYMNQKSAAKFGAVFRDGGSVPGAGELAISLEFTKIAGSANDITAGTFYYGTSKSNMPYSEAATVAADNLSATLTALTAGVKYFWKFVATVHVDYVGVESGIYSGTPT